MPTVKLEHVRQLNDLGAALTHLHLDIIGHAELWGALSAATAAVQECRRIAQRDIDPAEVAALRRQRAKLRKRLARR